MDNEEEESWFSGFVQQLSGIMIIIIIAGGILICLLLFIFAKRQIERFAIRSHRGTTTPGSDASKAMRREISRRMDAIKKITYEPKMLQEDSVVDNGLNDLPCHYYRMKTMDESKNLEDNILRKKLGKRQNFESLRSYLISMLSSDIDPRIVHQYCDLYEGARFNPKPFTEKDYKQFLVLLEQVRMTVIKMEKRSIPVSRDSYKSKSSTSDTSQLLRRSKWIEKTSSSDGQQMQGGSVAMTESSLHHITDPKHLHESTQV